MKTIDELVDELAVRLNSGQTVKQKKVAKPVSAHKPEVKKSVKNNVSAAEIANMKVPKR